jgi:TonB family protein
MIAILVIAIAVFSSTSQAEGTLRPDAGSIQRIPPGADPNQPVTQPKYPLEAWNSGTEGEVILAFHVRVDGSVAPESIRIQKTSGSPLLDQSAVSEAALWRFTPETENGRPVGADHQFRVVFDLSRAGSRGIQMRAEDFPGSLADEQNAGAPFIPMNMEGGDGYAPP